MKGWKNRVHVHWKWDLFLIGGFVLLSLPYAFANAHFFTNHGLPTEWYEEYTALVTDLAEGDPLTIFYDSVLAFFFILWFNNGFRTFEWNDKSFCMKSMFQRRCYRWDQVEEVIFDYRYIISLGGRVNILTKDGGFYYGPLHKEVERLFREKNPDICRTMDYEDQIGELSYWRARRKNSGVKMMFFQP